MIVTNFFPPVKTRDLGKSSPSGVVHTWGQEMGRGDVVEVRSFLHL